MYSYMCVRVHCYKYIYSQEEFHKNKSEKTQRKKSDNNKNNSRKHLRTKEHEFKVEKAHGVLSTTVKSDPHQDIIMKFQNI